MTDITTDMQADAHAVWVPAAVANDILDGTVVPATLPTGRIAIWRSASGKLHANGDRCPHRGMRLSYGFVRGETLSCIYHGWRFGPDGACQHIPAHPSVVPPKSINCGPLPVLERDGVAWVAAAEPAQAPPDYAGHAALRSLVIAADPAAILEASGGTRIGSAIQDPLPDPLLDPHSPLSAHLLLNQHGPQETTVIALVDAAATTGDRLNASAALEALRTKAEALACAEVDA